MAQTDTAPAETGFRTERRLAGRALIHWESLRGSRGLPSPADYGSARLPFEPEHAFMIEIGGEGGDCIVAAGAGVIGALGADIIGKRADEVFPSSRELGLSFYRTAATLRKPIADVGEFTSGSGHDIAYRCILLPLADGERSVTRIAGAFSFKRRG